MGNMSFDNQISTAFCSVQFVTECWSVCRTTVEQLQNEINALDTRIKKVRKQIDLPSTEKEIKMQMGEFLQVGCSQQLLTFCLSNKYSFKEFHYPQFHLSVMKNMNALSVATLDTVVHGQ
jgi:hypothetical protein